MLTTGRDLVTFGELLKGFRTRRHLTQKRLAEAIGVHRNAIGRWEHGDFLPASRGMVLELARKLHLDDQETRRLLETSLTTSSPCFHSPFYRNTFFSGREELLEALHTLLMNNQAFYALYGRGGTGKTQIALEYVYRHALEYSAVFWIESETEESIIASMIRIAEILQLPESQETKPQRIVAAVQHWLATHCMWLLIWDGLEDQVLLQRFLPPFCQGAILITTQNPALNMVARSLEVLPMGAEEGILLMLRRAKMFNAESTDEPIHQFAQRLPGEYRAAEELVQILDGLPLALDQVGAYIEENICSFSGYLQRYQQQRRALLDRRGACDGNHPFSVLATCELAFQRVKWRAPAAFELLCCCAFVSADAIPEEFFIQGASNPDEMFASIAADSYQLDQILAVLHSLSLLRRHPETQTFSLPRLMLGVLREKMSEQEQLRRLKRVLAVLNQLFPEVTYEVWEQCERLLPHVLACIATRVDCKNDRNLVEVLRKSADYLYARGYYQQAEPLYQRALHIWEHASGLECSEMALLLHHLAHLYIRQEKCEHAKTLFQRAHTIFAACLGQFHPATVQAQRDYQRLRQHLASLQGQPTSRSMTIAVRGKAEQIAYTRRVNMREVTITCQVCGQTVTVLRYPGGRISYCSEVCKKVRMEQINEERVRKQREKRHACRESSRSRHMPSQ